MRTDLFAFSASGQMEHHATFHNSLQEHDLLLSEGEKHIVAIVNSPYNFNDQALTRIESLEQLRFKFKDDSPQHPAMSGSAVCVVAGSGTTVEMAVTPLMCSVILSEVSNNLSRYRLLENPRIRLLNMNAEAEILRTSGFRPAENSFDGELVPLPCDIGFYTQYPGTALCCYPDETPDDVLGTQQTELLFECEIQDTTRRFTVPLPPLKRGCICPVGITVDETPENTYICTYVSTSQNM